MPIPNPNPIPMPPTDPVRPGVPRRRLFVVDHMCVLPYGHNQGAVALFRRVLAPHFAESYALVPRTLPAASAERRGFTRCLNYPYNAFYYRRFEAWFRRSIKHEGLRIWLQLWLRRAEKVLLDRMTRLLGVDVVLSRTERNWKEQFESHHFGKDDLIFFPSADFYGAAALLDLMAKGEASAMPRVHLRMVNVMENAMLGDPDAACDLLIAKARKAVAQGADVGISAETPAYLAYLAEKMGAEILFFPYPLVGEAMPMPRSQPVIAAAIGSGRGDKGYFLWAEIIAKTASQLAAQPAALSLRPIAYEIQAVPAQDLQYRPEYDVSLAKMANVRLFPAISADGEFHDRYRRSSVVVLPYDPKTYVFRGSAIYQEAIAYTRPVVCLAGAAFADLIGRYENGFACADLEAMAAALVACASTPAEEWDERLAISRSRYEQDVKAAIAAVLGVQTRRPVLPDGPTTRGAITS